MLALYTYYINTLVKALQIRLCEPNDVYDSVSWYFPYNMIGYASNIANNWLVHNGQEDAGANINKIKYL